MHKHKTLFVFNMLLLVGGTASATIWYVHPDSTQNCIQDCLDACSASDTVLVGPGTYYENITWPTTDSIVLISEYGRDTTIIDGSHADPVIYALLADSSTVISGFTIQNGYGNLGTEAGGICVINSYLLITNNIITNNEGVWSGGISAISGGPVITNNIIRENVCDTAGAGILSTSGSVPTILDNEITNNHARWGGGVYFAYSNGYLTGNFIAYNSAIRYGGGVGVTWYSNAILKHNTLTENQADLGGGGIYFYNNAAPTIDSCIISYNTEGIYNTASNCAPTIHYCNIVDNIGLAARNISTTIDCKYNWWGHATGPYHPNTNPGGLGDTVSNGIDFDPWLDEPVGVVEYQPNAAATSYLCVYPNPFSKLTIISFEVDSRQYGVGSIKIYDISGRCVKALNSLPFAHGALHVSWDGSDSDGNRLPSGVYFLKLQGGEYSKTTKLLLVR